MTTIASHESTLELPVATARGVVLLAGSASTRLAGAVARALGLPLAPCATGRFPDGEVHVRLDEPVRGCDVVLVAATAPPVNDHLVELIAFADACHRAGAARLVAVMPYFGYARSDRRDGLRTPIMASVVARLLEDAGVGQVITLDVHTPALEGFFRITADNVSAVPVLADALRAHTAARPVVVAPDLGAVKLANAYAALLDLDVAICHKRRLGGAEVRVERMTGDVAGRPCIVVDDMISTGGTIVECTRALADSGAAEGTCVAATHAVLAPGALERLAAAGVHDLVCSDSIPLAAHGIAVPDIEVVTVAPLLATAVRHVLDGSSLRAMA